MPVKRIGESCSTAGCNAPLYIGDLCASCYRAATPARRATEHNPAASRSFGLSCAPADLRALADGLDDLTRRAADAGDKFPDDLLS